MTLSTSSSELSLLLKSMIITCLTVVLTYHLLIVTGGLKPGTVIYPNDCISQILKYASSPLKKPSVVMIGSSKLKMVGKYDKAMPKNWYNLCLAGHSSIEGCDAILLSGKYPDVLLVEASDRIIDFPKSDHPAAAALAPWRTALIALSPMFEERYKPTVVLMRMLDIKTDWRAPRLDEQSRIRRKRIEAKKRPTAKGKLDELRATASILKDKLRKIMAHGVNVLIVDVPEDKELQDSTQVRLYRETLKEVLVEPEFSWYIPERLPWETRDGVHLNEAWSRRFSTMLQGEVRKRGWD